MSDRDVLDDPVWASLTGPHVHLAQGWPLDGSSPRALRYPSDVSMLTAVSSLADDEAWVALRRLVGPGESIILSGPPDLADRVPEGWLVDDPGQSLQLVATDALAGELFPEAVRLGAADWPEMLDLATRTQLGPVMARTHELGRYLGIRRGGVLVAMAGERVRPPGWSEISAVCTDEAFRGQGLAKALVSAVVHGIRKRGELPFLHTATDNTTARRLYESMGFRVRTQRAFFELRTSP